MTNWWNLLRQRLSEPSTIADNDVEKIAALQQDATRRRAEYATKRENAESTGDPELLGAVTAARRKMEDAESAHMIALQKWQNKQSRQKSY